MRDTDAAPAATGYAHESVTSRGVNLTSALENCETSAIGRALANLGYAPKGKRPSREEMAKANRQPVSDPDWLRDAAIGIEEAKTATDLDTWQSGPATVEQIGVPVPNGDGTETVRVRVIAPVSQDPTRFIRLRITVAE